MINLLSALLTPLVAVVAVWIAWRQSSLAQQKLMLDLFDRRFKIYEDLLSSIRPVIAAGKPSYDDLGAYWRAEHQAQFLFGPDITEYLDTVETALRECIVAHDEMANLPVGPERSQKSKQAMSAILVVANLPRALPELLAPYMRMQGRMPRTFVQVLAEANSRRLAAGEDADPSSRV